MPAPTRRRKAAESGRRRTVSAVKSSKQRVDLDDRPLRIQTSRDGKWLFVTLPFELCIVDARTLVVQRSIELPIQSPSVAEDLDDTLWIGGHHLYRGNIFQTSVSKHGTKLSGYVDHIALLRPGLLAGVGSQGEILLNTEEEKIEHQRKSNGLKQGVLASADERAVFLDGSNSAWIIDTAHPSGYAQLRFPTSSNPKSSDDRDPDEDLVGLSLNNKGRCILAARDGGIAWTNSALRLSAERFPRSHQEPALALAADERWVYALRENGILQRFLIEQPAPPKKKKLPPAKARLLSKKPTQEDEIPQLPEAQECRLEAIPETFVLIQKLDNPAEPKTDSPTDGELSENGELVLGRSCADGQLGQLSRIKLSELNWKDLPLGQRSLRERETNGVSGSKAPDFTPIRTKISGSPLSKISVDEVISGSVPFYVIADHGGPLTNRETTRMDPKELLPADALLLPAMLRMAEGTVRPGMIYWPGAARKHFSIPRPSWLTWGDQSSGWIELDTPTIREQGWSRRDVFPLQSVVTQIPKNIPGRRFKLSSRWEDAQSFAALALECKKLLKVLW